MAGVSGVGNRKENNYYNNYFYLRFACLPSTVGMGWVTGCDEIVGITTSHDNET